MSKIIIHISTLRRSHFCNLYTTILIVVLMSSYMSAQQSCGVNGDLERLMVGHPHFVDQLAKQNDDVLDIGSNRRSLIIIPIVVHVVYPDYADSMTHVAVYQQIDQLNKDFNAINDNLAKVPSLFEQDIADIGIKFCLATRSPKGNSTSGIEQRSTQDNLFGEQLSLSGDRSIKHAYLEGYDAWDTKRYVNVWIGELDGIAGTATFPNLSLSGEDGIIIDYQKFGKDHRTLTHEIGHYLNLKHMWGEDESCDTDDDVMDTPQQSVAYYGCPNFPQLSCQSADMFMNFMDYTDDNCVAFFTKGQRDRMLNSLALYRPLLAEGNTCETDPNKFDLLSDLVVYTIEDNLRLSYVNFPTELIRYTMYNIGGQLIVSGVSIDNSGFDISIIELPRAMYFLRVEHGLDHRIIKFVK